MLTRFDIDCEAEMERWDSFVRPRPDGTPFHISGWLRTIRSTYSFEPVLYAFRDDAGEVTGVFPFFRVKNLFLGFHLVSLPFSDYGGPLFERSGDLAEAVEGVIDDYGRKTSYIELRGPLDGPSPFVGHGHYWTHTIDLSEGVEAVYNGLNRKTIRYSIRKAEKAGVRIEEDNSPEAIDSFYRLNLLTRKKHGVPPQSKKWFTDLLERVISKGDGFVLLARSESRTIAAGVFLRCGRKVCYKYSVSDPAFLSNKTPGHLLTWKAIEKSCLEGRTSFDFGRTSPGNSGLKKYKEMWGAVCTLWPYCFYPEVRGMTSREGSSPFLQAATCLWRKLPDLVTTRVGPFLLKKMG